MIDIGNTLRSARLRRDLDLHDCELETRIRARYLAAMEDERFEVLPEPAYARGFLRNYATFLGLDARVLVEEYDDRFGVRHEPSEPVAVPVRAAPRRQRMSMSAMPARRRTGRRRGNLVWLAIGIVGAGVIALWAGAAWQTRPAPLVTPGGGTHATTGATAATLGQIRLTGSPGTGSLVTVRVADRAGALVFSGAIPPGASRTFALTRPLWVAMGASTGVTLAVDGIPAQIPAGLTAVVVQTDGTVRGA